MAKHIVKCLYCGEQFDRDTEKCVKIGRRYAHQECYDKLSDKEKQENLDKSAFWAYIKELYHDDYDFVSISKQVESYVKQYHFTYSGMLKALKWFYEIQHHSKEESNGRVGILPYIYEDARKYYYGIFLAQQRMKESNNFKIDIQEVTILSPTTHSRPIKLWFSEDED